VLNRSGILGAGNWIVDKIKVIDVWPNREALAIIQEETRGNVGAPFNVLIDLAKLGAAFPLQGAGVSSGAIRPATGSSTFARSTTLMSARSIGRIQRLPPIPL
jgi:hypothetical protein